MSKNKRARLAARGVATDTVPSPASRPPAVRHQPLVDILIPVYNHSELVESCISTLPSTTSVPYRLTLIDDASPDPKVRPYLASKTGVANVMHNTQNMGFGQTVNKAARSAYAKYLMILNSDTEPLPGWLDVMVDAMESHEDYGVAGALLLFHPESPNGPGGRVQHAGMCFTVTKQPRHRYIAWPADHPKVRQFRDDLQAVTGACMLVRRSLWNDIGGFEKAYGVGCFEDTELTLKSLILRKKVVYCPDAMLYHRVGASAMDRGGFPLQMNYRIFQQRMGAVVKYDEWSTL